MAKKPLCESVTKSCVNVASQVWDTFLREVAPQVKNAELIAEDKARQDCIGNISSCFQKACKDTIDPNDPDGSYDMCLSRPGTMLNVCKIPLNACGIDATSETAAAKSDIWDFVVARLASMRVDACTTEVKNCLQSDDRCGKDYTQCIGLDLEALRQMCPLEKLVACQTADENDNYAAQWDKFDSIVQGIWLGIDNAMLEQCQNIVNEKMIEICGDTATCPIFNEDIAVGQESLVNQQKSNGDWVISGLISFSNVDVTQDEDTYFYSIDVNKYMTRIADASSDVQERIGRALNGIKTEIDRRVSILSEDPQISMCVHGRDIRQILSADARNARPDEARDRAVARFPALLGSVTYVIANSILEQAKSNYDAKYADLISDIMTDSEQAKNLLYCNAMVQKEDFSTKIDENNAANGINKISDWEVVINATGVKETATLMSGMTDKEEVLLDTNDRMIAKRTTSGIYEPGTKICRITVTTYPCTGFEAIYNYESSSYSAGASASFMGFGGGASYSQSKASNTYQGNFCATFAEPVISEQLINMQAGTSAMLANTTRSNLTTYYNDQSSESNITQKSGGGVSIGISTGDISNIGSRGKSKTINKTDNSTNTTNNTTNTNQKINKQINK